MHICLAHLYGGDDSASTLINQTTRKHWKNNVQMKTKGAAKNYCERMQHPEFLNLSASEQHKRLDKVSHHGSVHKGWKNNCGFYITFLQKHANVAPPTWWRGTILYFRSIGLVRASYDELEIVRSKRLCKVCIFEIFDTLGLPHTRKQLLGRKWKRIVQQQFYLKPHQLFVPECDTIQPRMLNTSATW